MSLQRRQRGEGDEGTCKKGAPVPSGVSNPSQRQLGLRRAADLGQPEVVAHEVVMGHEKLSVFLHSGILTGREVAQGELAACAIITLVNIFSSSSLDALSHDSIISRKSVMEKLQTAPPPFVPINAHKLRMLN